MWKSQLKGEKRDLGIREFKRIENFVLKNKLRPPSLGLGNIY